MRILHIEDDEPITTMFSWELSELGHDYISLSSRDEVLRYLSNEGSDKPVDAIIQDATLSSDAGALPDFAVFDAVRDYKVGRKICWIVLSARSEHRLEQLKRLYPSMDFCVPKQEAPDIDKLLELIESVIKS